MSDLQPPPGFEPLFRTRPFLDHLGPFFMRKQQDGTFVVGLRVLAHHANGRGGAHGGLLMTLCDIALGYRATSSVHPRPMLTTDRKSTRLNSSHLGISYAVFCLKKKRKTDIT